MIQIIVKRGLGDKEAPTIQDDRIVSEQMAIRRGANYLNSVWYVVEKRGIKVPHREQINDGKIANINESHIPILEDVYIKSVKISITNEGIMNELSVESYQEFF